MVLRGAETHHLQTVRRGVAGDKVELFDGKGRLAQARITAAGRGKVTLMVEHVTVVEPAVEGRVIMAVSLAKGRRFDQLIGKCTELGVDRICPVLFERTIKLAQGTNAAQRYEKLTIEASKQCGRLFLPAIDEPIPLGPCAARLKEDYPLAHLLIGSLQPDAEPLVQLPYVGDVLAFVGPEGGLTRQEEQLLCEHGAKQTRLTDTTLRIETAATAFAAILCACRDAAR